MSDTTVRLQIKVSGEEGFRKAEISADDLRGAIEQVRNEAEKVNSSLINSNQIAQAFEQVSSAVQGLQSVMHDLTDAYAVQAQAETRLATVMRNTMDATEDEIQSIKDLASAQQELGVVGDEVQLSGAQELATYLGKKESLEKLIPVMNDMIAQQYGYNATAESAVGIATMMGKVMEGQTKALSRYGYSFTEAQEEILKFGTEEQRAATLAEVIEQSVGGVNEALAATPYGKIVQANNKFGDMKETLGSLVAPAMTVVDNIARISIAVAGLGKGIATIKSLGTSIRALGIHSKVTAAAQRILGAAGFTAAAGTTALRVAVAALYATITFGLSLAIQAVITLLTSLTSKTQEAAESVDELEEANDALKSAFGQAKSEIDAEIAALKRLIETNGDATDAIKHLNQEYSEAFGYHKTAAEWYEVLIEKSEAYCRQLAYEAKAKQLSAKLGELLMARDALQEEIDNNHDRYYTTNSVPDPVTHQVNVITHETRKYKRQKKQLADLNAKIAVLEPELEKTWAKAGEASDELKGKTDEVTQAVAWQQMSYTELGKEIQRQKEKLGDFSDASSKEAQAERALLQAMTERYNALGKALGLASDNTKKLQEDLSREPLEPMPTLTPRPMQLLEVPKANMELKTQTQGFQNLEQINRRIMDLQQQRLKASKEEIPVIDSQIAYVERLRDEFEGISRSKMPSFSDAWNGIKGIGSSISSIKDALTETDNAWDALTQTIDGFISLFQSIKSVIEIIENITAVTKTMQAARTAAATTAIAENSAESASEAELAATRIASNAAVSATNAVLSTSNTAAAATAAANSVASTPYVGPALAIAAAEAVYATLSAIPKFAGGALVYGPTVGLMGEYAGASSNPEVIAPLNKLRGILGEGRGRTEVEFRIKGRELVGILNKQNNIYERSK